MHIIFLNPQGNFDQRDSHLTEHPDFGGQLIYVKEVCRELAEMGHTVDIVTRQIQDPDWPEFDKEIDYYDNVDNLRIIRIPFGGKKFLKKELLWEHLDEYTDNILQFYGDSPPEFATAHYGDGGYSGVLLKKKAELKFTFTGHSLGAQKLDKLGMDLSNYDELESQYFFSKRIAAERLSMHYASRIITSTTQEQVEQYGHPLYRGAVYCGFSVIPPGVNTRIFSTEEGSDDREIHDYLEQVTKASEKPFVIVSSRLDEKKNHKGVALAYARSKILQEKANLGLMIRGVDDPEKDIGNLREAEQDILKELLAIIKEYQIQDKVFFFNLLSQRKLAAAYRYFAEQGSIFSLTAFYEPFGLAPIEAAACGLPAVVTKFGGPSEIFKDEKGELVDPFDLKDIAHGLINGLEEQEKFAKLQKNLVMSKYTWRQTAESYLEVIEEESKNDLGEVPANLSLDASDRIKTYLAEK